MPGKKEHSGGARPGSGPVRRRFTVSYGTAVLIRELTRSRLGKRDVTEDELTGTVEAVIKAAVDSRLDEIDKA